VKLAINLTLSFTMLALCAWFLWPDHATRDQIDVALGALRWSEFAPYLYAYLGLLVVVHLCRSLRWNHLLAPLGAKIPVGPLLAISSVGFMAILALPARLGEFARPGLLRKRGVSGTAALGTVAVERVVDGLMISLFVFGAFFALRGPDSPSWMMWTAYGALALFSFALAFLVCALRRPAATVRFCLRLSLLPKLAPRLALIIEDKLLEIIRGFDVLKDQRNLGLFVLWSAVYWVCNGLGVYVLARGFDLHLSVIGAFATMGLVGIGIMLPNAPGLVGQFQWFTLLGLSLYLGADAAQRGTALYAKTFVFANVHYVLQLLWYVTMGILGLASPWVSFQDLWTARKVAPVPLASDDPGG
jgi:uncharacterized protein (TIRG00374 family)